MKKMNMTDRQRLCIELKAWFAAVHIHHSTLLAWRNKELGR